MNYVYILKCNDGTLYTGWTNNLENRLAVHNLGCGAKYTRSRLPVELVYFRTYDTRSEAMREECRIKRLSRAEKMKLIRTFIEEVHQENREAIQKLIVERKINQRRDYNGKVYIQE